MEELSIRRQGRFRLAVVAALLALAAVATGAAAAGTSPYTVANYPVEARASDAVTAKERAIADGQQGAFRSLLKRLVPVTSYHALAKLKGLKTDSFLEGFAVKSERNSENEYLATLDFSFNAKSIQGVLRSHGLAWLDEQAAPVVVVPIYHVPGVAPAPAAAPAKGAKAVPAAPTAAPLPTHLAPDRAGKVWHEVWKGLDLEHALAPVSLKAMKAEIHGDAVKQAMAGDAGALRIFSSEYNAERIVVAIAEPDIRGRKLTVTLVGHDAVGPLMLKRSYKIAGTDVAYAAEYAAVVAVGVLEGRWKALRVRSRGPALSAAGVARIEPVQFTVEFSGRAEWEQIRRRIEDTPGVDGLEVTSISARGAFVMVRYPGGAESLTRAFFDQGLYLRSAGGSLILAAH